MSSFFISLYAVECLNHINKVPYYFITYKQLIIRPLYQNHLLKMKKLLLFIFIVFTANQYLAAQNELFLKKEFISKSDTLRYRILFPDNYDITKKYPLVLFLHGSGERGSDNMKQLVHGSYLFTNQENRKDFPAIVIFPQCPSNDFWAPINDRSTGKFSYVNAKHPTKAMQLVIDLTKSIIKKEAVDSKRVYVIGLSMGGMGTFDLICREPKLFAAAVPICGGVNNERLKKVKKMPIRIYHGEIDPVVPLEHSKSAYETLKSFGSKKCELIVFPETGHNSWDQAFKQPDFVSWIFSKKLK